MGSWPAALEGDWQSPSVSLEGVCLEGAQALRHSHENKTQVANVAPTVSTLIEQYREKKMPERASTRRGYEVFIRN